MDAIQICLLDCSSIQHYVFGSNKLKANVGASHLVEKVYAEWIPQALQEVFPADGLAEIRRRFEQWQHQPDKLLLHDENVLWETGYVGGGNALLIFRAAAGADPATAFLQSWTRRLLLEAPGLRPAAAIIRTTLAKLAEGIGLAFEDLRRNKNHFLAETQLPRHGLTAECHFTGLAEEVRHPLRPAEWISAAAHAKIRHAEEANRSLALRYREVLHEAYEFPEETEQLGQARHRENHVAIVHIDGNGLGERFKACRDLVEMRWLSLAVDQAMHAALAATLSRLLAHLSVLNEKVLQWQVPASAGRAPLPLRPLILSGDDATFVCEARLGLFLAETFMVALAGRPVQVPLPPGAAKTPAMLEFERRQPPLTSGGGVAIIKTKYPFYRGYQLAASLCSEAKRVGRSRDQKEGRPGVSSWLDFHMEFGGLSSALGEMRMQQYEVAGASLLWRPWRIAPAAGSGGSELNPRNQTDLFSFEVLKRAVVELAYHPEAEKRWPRSKRHELAQALSGGRERTGEFLSLMAARGLQLPEIPLAPQAKATGWHELEGLRTPYFDVIEAMDFYPECLLGGGSNHDAVPAPPAVSKRG
ncbi:MAG: hypothetical protein DKINENOH_04829 [bacterium]|nr:hypothetical protein [bacterium]